MGLIDIHAHFDMLDDAPEQVIAKAKAMGVDKIVTIGTEPSDHQYVLDVAKKFYPQVYCTLGVHPHQGMKWTSEVGNFIEAHLQEPWVIAVGEIGLDYYYNESPKADQLEAFEKQLEIARKYNMPVEIHTRDAEADTVDMLKKFQSSKAVSLSSENNSQHISDGSGIAQKNNAVTGLIHCFTGTRWLAEQCLDLGYNISFSGIVTFKNANDLREVCKFVPLNRMHVETDAPFLTPVPLRGQKNTPAYVAHTAQFVADLKGVSLEKLIEQTNENARQLFPKIIW